LHHVVDDHVLAIPEANGVAGTQILERWLTEGRRGAVLSEYTTRAPKNVHSARTSEDADSKHHDEDNDREQDEGSERINQLVTGARHSSARR
jgi:hypothetical protein